MTEFYWRIAMEGDQGGLDHPYAYNRGDAGGTYGGNVSPFVRAGELDATFTYIDHARAVARSIERAGFAGALLPSFPHTHDPWAFSASLVPETTAFRFMIAYQPGFLHPVQVARQAASLQRASGGRLLFNVISGGGGDAQLWWGDRIGHDDRYRRTKEFLDILKGVWDGPFHYEGDFFRTAGASLPPLLRGQEFPEIYFSGSSSAAIDAAGRHADFYLSWLEPRPQLLEKIRSVRETGARLGQHPRIALRIDVLARRTPEAAWRVIERAWGRTEFFAQSGGRSRGDSVGASRLAAAVPQSDDWRQLEIEPNVWGGFHRLRPGPALGIVGSYEQAAEHLQDLIDAGVDAFILAGVPHLEEAERVGTEVLPLLRASQSTTPTLTPGQEQEHVG
jgi:alkanesulfonate monooxygenase